MEAKIEIAIRSPHSGKVRRFIVDSIDCGEDAPVGSETVYAAAIALDEAEAIAARYALNLQTLMVDAYRAAKRSR